MDGIAALATTANVELANRVNLSEKDSAELKKSKLTFSFSADIVLVLKLTWVRWFTAVWMTSLGNWKATECERQRFSVPHQFWSYLAFYPISIRGFFFAATTVCE
jgi:hypothetical protein